MTWFDIPAECRSGRVCASADCGKQAVARLEVGGVASDYCGSCGEKIDGLMLQIVANATKHASKPKHRARAVEAIAYELCVTDYTDGFCAPRDGVCLGAGVHNCMRAAEGCMRAMESRGVVVVWPCDKEK